jgi:hypothetical protein
MPPVSVATEPLLAAVDRAESGDLATAGRFGDAAIHAQVLHLQAEQSVVGGQHGQAQLLGDSGGDPFVAAAAQRGRRAAVVGDAAVAAAEHQDLDELSKTTRSGMRGRWQPSGWAS